MRALLRLDDTLCVCLGPRELSTAPIGALVVLLGAAQDATWLNLARPVISERELRVFVWLEPGDRSVLRDEATDFLDWMRQTVDIPPGTPRYAIEALRDGIARGDWIAWMGPGVEAHLPPDVPVVRRADDSTSVVDAMRRGVVLVYGVRDAHDLGRLVDARAAAERDVGIILVEPACVGDGTVVVHAIPMRWWDAAERFARVEIPNPGLAVAFTGLDPVAVGHISGEGVSHPTVVEPSSGPEPLAVLNSTPPDPRSSVTVSGDIAGWSAVATVFPMLPTPLPAHLHILTPATREIGRHIHELYEQGSLILLAGWRGCGKSTVLDSLSDELSWSVPLRVEVAAASEPVLPVRPHSANGTPAGVLKSIGSAVMRAASDALSHPWGSMAERFQRLASSVQSHRGSDAAPALVRAIGELVSELRSVYDRTPILMIDGLDHPYSDTLVSRVVRMLLRQPLPCHVIITASGSLSWRYGGVCKTVRLVDTQVLDFGRASTSGEGVQFLLELLRRRLDYLELIGSSGQHRLRDEKQAARLVLASGGRPSSFIRLVRSWVAHLATAPRFGHSDPVAGVIEDERARLSSFLVREDARVIDSIVRAPRRIPILDERVFELLDLGILCEYRDAEGPWYAPHPLVGLHLD